jgi:hypothetical protein
VKSANRRKIMTNRTRLGLAICVLGLIVMVGLAIGGCGGPGATHRVTVDTEYYRDGPQQARPADGTLAAGTIVRLVKESGSYSLVETSNRLQVYIASDSLQPLK